MQHRFSTPERSTLNRLNTQNQPSQRHYYNTHQSNRYDYAIDYKAKAFQLMQTLNELQIKQKESHRTISYLQRQLQLIHSNLDQFLSEFAVSSLSQVKSIYIHLTDQMTRIKKENQKPLNKNQKITQEYQQILGEYKKMIKYQEEKMSKYQNKWKTQQIGLLEQCQNLSKRQQYLNQQLEQSLLKNNQEKETMTQNHKVQINKLQSEICRLRQELNLQNKKEAQKAKQNQEKLLTENIQMKQDLDILKTQFRDLLVEKQTIEQKHQKLKKKYKNQIQHFEMIEKEVEQKLIEVQKQITFYKEQRQSNLQLIQKLQYQNQILKQNSKQLEEQFSFGGYFNAQTQTQNSQLESEILMNAECYEISIKSLLDENTRLKKTLVLLDKTKRGEEIPAEAQLQLRLLKGLTESPLSRSKRAERDSEESPKFRVLDDLQRDSKQFNNTS